MAAKKSKPKTKVVRKAAPAGKKASAVSRARRPAAKAGAMPPKLEGIRKREFDAIYARATALGGALTEADFDSEGNPVNPTWVKMLGDLDAWAAKHKIPLKIHEHDHAQTGAGGTPTTYTACPATTTNTSVEGGLMKYKISYLCTLKRRTLLGRCVYNCVTTGWTYL